MAIDDGRALISLHQSADPRRYKLRLTSKITAPNSQSPGAPKRLGIGDKPVVARGLQHRLRV